MPNGEDAVIILEDQQLRMARSEIKAAMAFEQEYGGKVVELLTPEQTRSREPAITGDLMGAKYVPTTGQVRNPRLLAALKAACASGGVSIVEGCEVKQLIVQSERVTGVRTADGTCSAQHVVLAAGCWSSLLDEQLAALMPVVPVRGQIALLEMPARPFEHVLERGRGYLVPRADGRIILGATQEPEAGYDCSITVAGVAGLLNLGLRLVPGLGAARLAQTWAGLRPGTPDGRPFIGPVPGFAGLIAATGHFRSGLTLAPVTARVVVELISHGTAPYDLARCLPGREIGKRLIPVGV